MSLRWNSCRFEGIVHGWRLEPRCCWVKAQHSTACHERQPTMPPMSHCWLGLSCSQLPVLVLTTRDSIGRQAAAQWCCVHVYGMAGYASCPMITRVQRDACVCYMQAGPLCCRKATTKPQRPLGPHTPSPAAAAAAAAVLPTCTTRIKGGGIRCCFHLCPAAVAAGAG